MADNTMPQGLNAFQQQQYLMQQHYQNTPTSQYIPQNSSLEGFLGADPEYQGYLQSPWLDQSEIDAAKQRAITRYQGKSTTEMAQASKDYSVNEAQQHIDYANSHPDGGDDFMDKFMGIAMPIVVGAIMGGGALGMMGGETAGGLAAGTEGAGSLGGTLGASELGGFSTAGMGLDSMGWAAGLGDAAGATGAGLGTGAAGAGAGLGSMIGVEGGAPAVVSIGAPAAAGGAGLGGAVAAGAGAIGLGSMAGGDDPNMPRVVIPPPAANVTPPADPPASAGDYTPPITPVPIPSFPVPPISGDPPSSVGDVPHTPVTIPAFPLPVINPGSGGTPGTTPGGGTTPVGGIPGNVLGGLGDLLGGIVSNQMNTADKDYYQNLMDKMMGMYQPGTPEATLMQQKMEAQDAAAGRNSQYGTRATNLAGMLAQQRGNIMTSPTFARIAEDSRGHYDNSLNGLFGALGSATSGGNNWLGSLGNLFGLGNSSLNTPAASSAPTR